MLRIYRKQRLWIKVFVLAAITLLLMIFAVYAVVWDSSDEDEIDFRNFRAEGLSFYEAAPSGIKYFKKYYFKSWNAADSIKLFLQNSRSSTACLKRLTLKITRLCRSHLWGILCGFETGGALFWTIV